MEKGVIKWFDNKPVIMAPSAYSTKPHVSEKKKHVQVSRSGQYNTSMGDVDMADWMLSFYKMSSHAQKWTVHIVFWPGDLHVIHSV